MAVDDVPLLLGKSEFIQYCPGRGLILQKAVVGILLLPVRLLVCQEIPLKGSHLVLAKQRGVLMEPDIPADIPSLFLFLTVGGHKTLASIAVQPFI